MLAVIVALVLVAGGLAARSALWYETADFFCLYQGARSLVIGLDPYDEVAWRSTVGGPYPDPRGGVAMPPCPGRYGYPLWSAVLLVPLGALPIEIASSLWMAVSIGAAVLGSALAWRAFGGTSRYAGIFGVSVVMSQPFWIFLLSGQSSGMLLGLAGTVAWAIARERERLGGVALALLAFKPQTSVITIPVVFFQALATRRRRFIVAATVAAALLIVVPLLFVRDWPFEWLGEVSGRRLRVITQMPTAWGFAAQTVGDATWGAAFLAGTALVTALIAWGRADRVTVFVLTLPLSLLATPYAWTYDYLVLAVAWGFILARAEAGPPVTRTALLAAGLSLAVILPWVLYALSFTRGEEALSATLAAATAVVGACAARVRRREG